MRPTIFYINLLLTIILLNLFISKPVYAVQQNYAEVESYINKVIQDGSMLLANKELSVTEKANKTKDLISNNLDLNWMAQYTLGRTKKTIDSSKVEEFSKVYAQYVIKTYTALVENYKGETTNVKAINALDANEYMVNTEIIKSTGDVKFKADYLIRNLGNAAKPNFKIADIITEGVSMINSQQSEFESVIMNQGIDELIKSLKSKLSVT